jgi:hypothetical protein
MSTGLQTYLSAAILVLGRLVAGEHRWLARTR